MGELRLRNAIKFDKRLDNVNLSAALGKFVVENHYVSDDGNEYVYFLLDSSISFKLVFKNYEAFLACVQDISPYKLLLDGRSVVKLQHMLLAGRTGSGKSVMLIFLVLQASVYKGYKRDKIEMRGDRAEMSDFPLYLNTVAGGLDCRNQAIGGFSFVVKIYALPVVEIIGQLLYLLG